MKQLVDFGQLGLDRYPELFPHCLSLSKLLPFDNKPEHFPVVIGRVEEMDVFSRSQDTQVEYAPAYFG
jgi:hypothetical protein